MNSELNPKNFRSIYNLVEDAFSYTILDNTFTVFKSINKIIILIYANLDRSIISYNLINNKKINEIKNAHQNYITNFRHYLDEINNRDLVLSISAKDYNIRVWNINNYECILNLTNIHNFHSKNYNYQLSSACFLNNNNQIYIITSDYSDFIYSSLSDPIKIFDLNGNLIKEIKHYIYNNTLFIDTYFDKKLSKNYIITGNYGFVESYDFTNNNIYHKYTQYNNDINNKNHTYSYESLIISTLEDIENEKSILKLIASCSDGYIKIWNFHSGEILKLIKVFGVFLHSICLINNNYLAVGCGDKTIKIVDINKGKTMKTMFNQYDVNCIKSIIHPLYGICLISQTNQPQIYFYIKEKSVIKLWVNK